ncbi:hypothetical protein DFH11DRAFT_1590991 [Phellopilus nigrolimitatus]|nr:hypothetical protein DFH11DRAFT_1590991 [Phellopilus nigrolimitatus]
MSSSKTPFLDAVSASLPSVLSDLLLTFDVHSREKLDTLVRFCADGACPTRIAGHSDAWSSGQSRLHARLANIEPAVAGTKRAREPEAEADGNAPANGAGSSKKQKIALESVDDMGEPLYVLHALSVTAPVRKKVDISITEDAIWLTRPITKALEARVRLASITRAFLVSSLGQNKKKPQWAVTLISADCVDKNDGESQMQFAFNIDQSVAAGKEMLKTTAGRGAAPETRTKGEETLPILQAFLAHLPEHVELQAAPDPEEATQAFSSSANQPYVDAYRGAKEGSLCFLARGILWANARPCEFFALEDLAPDSDVPGMGGVKTLSATGRTFSVFLKRRGKGGGGDKEVEEGEETEFAMIDGREAVNVKVWVQKYRRFFGKPRSVAAPTSVRSDAKGKGKARAEPQEVVQEDDSDSSDEDFEAPSESDGGEPSSDSEGSDGDAGGQNDAEEEADAKDSDDDDEEGSEDENDENLDPARHPLMKPGAMPRMSKAAIDATVAMVLGDMVSSEDEEDDEEDQLE